MTTANTAGRGLAIAAGVVLATGTLAILFEDVLIHGAQFTLKHWLTLVTVAGTMMVGHLADLARRHRHWISLAGFTALFLAGTGLVVYSSVGRQAEKTMLSSAEHDDVVQKRNDLKSKLATESAVLKAKQDAADTECKTGDGRRCRGARAVATVWAESVAGLEARIEKLAPAKPVAPEAEQFATVAAALGYDREQVKALAMLLAPFFTTLFLEFGSIVSFGFAFSPRRQSRAPVVDDNQKSCARFTVSKGNRGNPGNGGSRRIYSKAEAEGDLVTRLAFGETVASQDALADRWQVNKSTVSKWLRDMEARQLIPARQQIGRCKTLVAT